MLAHGSSPAYQPAWCGTTGPARAHRHPGRPARAEQPLVAAADHDVGPADRSAASQPSAWVASSTTRVPPACAARSGVEVDEPAVGGLHHAHRDHVEVGRPLGQLAPARPRTTRHAPPGLRRERERDAGELARRHQHPGAVRHARRDQPDQRRTRSRRSPPASAGTPTSSANAARAAATGASKSGGRPAPVRQSCTAAATASATGDRRDADARGVEVAVGNVELATERGAHPCDPT